MVHRLKSPVLCATLLALAAGCTSRTKDEFPVPVAADGGLPNREVVDAPPEVGRETAIRPDATAAIGDGAAARDAASVKLTVQIVGPKENDVLPAAKRFTPDVSVTLEVSGDASDSIMEVVASVNNRMTMGKGPSAKLDESKVERTPEGNTSVHRYQETPLDVSKLPSGEYELVVTAKSAGGVMGEAKVTVLIDAGPIIRIDSPGENKYYRSATQVDVTILDPMFGPVDNVSLTLGQSPLMVRPGANPNQYATTIVFKDYDPPLQGDQVLTVRASNKNGTESVLVRRWVADDKGPTITNTVPKLGELIGRVITISAQVSDAAGVLDASVVAVVAHGDKTFEVKLQTAAAGSMAPAGTYVALFDTTRLPANAIFPSISFRASDVLGNESSIGYLLSLDNTSPVADLDPPATFRVVRKKDDRYQCSQAFDPLGPEAMNDLGRFTQLAAIRARVEDQGNRPEDPREAAFVPISAVDENRVQLLILDDTSQALVVDTNGDGLCDAVSPLITPTTTPMSAKDALLINMAPVPPGGAADFTPSDLPAGAPCGPGDESKPPEPLCWTTALPVAIPYGIGKLPSIWTIPPVLGDQVQCLGRQFDRVANHFQPGWICLAVVAADKLGNMQVSRPMRLCIGNSCPEPAPDCTGTQTAVGPPPVVDANRPCKPWRVFPAQEYLEIR